MRNEKRKNFLTLLAVTCSMLLIMGCSNPFESLKQSAPVEAGYGRVSINFAGGEERTVLPAKVFDNYVYTFTSGGVSSELSPDDEGLFTLEVGAWQVEVKAYVGEVDSDNLAATGTNNFTVSSGPTTEVEIVLDAVVTAGFGTFTYTVQYPSIANAEVTLKKLPGLTDSVDLTPGSEETNDGITVMSKTTENIPAGFYLLTILIRNGGWHAGISEAVHIYPLLTTEYAAEFDEDDLLPTVIDIANIRGITPVIGEAPVTAITETEQYTGTVEWDTNEVFIAVTTYTATITLTVKPGCLLQDVPENFFTVAGADSVSNAAGSGVITAEFTTPHAHLKVPNTTQWNNALSIIRGGGNDKRYIIEVDGNVGVGGITATNSTTGFGTVTGITVTLMGNGKLYLTSQGSIIRLEGANQTLVIDGDDLILEGLKNGQNGFSQNNNTSVVYVNGTNAKVELKNGTISGNTTTYDSSGGVYVSDSFTMSGGTISGNTSGGSGGGVYVSGSFTMSGGTISGNTSGGNTSGSGGGVYVSGNFTITGGTISGNTSSSTSYPSYGGGVCVSSGSFTMSGGTISGNTSSSSSSYSSYSSYGGGVYVSDSFTMSGGTISGNTSSSSYFSYGGGVYFGGSTNNSFTISGGIISNNTAGSSGGGVYAYSGSGTFTMNNGTISSNTAGSSGGGVYADRSFTMNNGTISSNTAGSSGGGVYVYYSSGSFTMSGGIISDNTSGSSGGGVSVGGTSFTMNNGTISGNTAVSSGGGVSVGGTFTMNNGTISGNTAGSSGGGVYAGSSFTMTGGIINGNTIVGSSSFGGGVYKGSSTLTIGGTAQIYGNTNSGAPNNVYLPSSQYITLGSNTNAPADGMNIYVQTGTANGVIVQSGATTDVLPYFHADQDGKAVILSGTQLVIVEIVGNITASDWRDGNAISLAAPTVGVSLPAGEIVTAEGWQISDNGSSWSNFTPPATADMSYNGKYLRYYAAISNGETYYSNTVTIRVTSQTTERGVTIAMYDSYGDGWDGGGALRITVNGVQIANNVRVSGGYTNTYTFSVTTGEVVQIYWVAGSSQGENSFIVYYTDTPPSPTFTTSNNNSWNGSNALVYRLRGTMNNISGGTLLGSFTAP